MPAPTNAGPGPPHAHPPLPVTGGSVLPTVLEWSGVRGQELPSTPPPPPSLNCPLLPRGMPRGLHRQHCKWSPGSCSRHLPRGPVPIYPTCAGHQRLLGAVIRTLWAARQCHINPTPPSVLDTPCESQPPSHSSPSPPRPPVPPPCPAAGSIPKVYLVASGHSGARGKWPVKREAGAVLGTTGGLFWPAPCPPALGG